MRGNKLILKTVFCGVVLMLASNSVLSRQASRPQSDNDIKEHTTSFRYIIFGDSVDETGGSESAERTVQVLLDDKAFSEETLRTLLRFISRRYPRPDWMTVWVLTNLKQIRTPEEEDRGRVSGTKSDPEFYQHHRALLIRHNGNELFRYNPNPPSPEMKTVIINGRDPQGPKR